MRFSIPLALSSTIGSNYDVEPDDIVVTKRSLKRLGYYKIPDWGLSQYPDSDMFEGIKNLQRATGLKVDGIIEPAGPTATKIGSSLSEKAPEIVPKAPSRDSRLAAKGRSQSHSDEECDHLYWNVDIPVCRAIETRRGKIAAAQCYHSATARYAACLRGIPMNELPPLDTWNQ